MPVLRNRCHEPSLRRSERKSRHQPRNKPPANLPLLFSPNWLEKPSRNLQPEVIIHRRWKRNLVQMGLRKRYELLWRNGPAQAKRPKRPNKRKNVLKKNSAHGKGTCFAAAEERMANFGAGKTGAEKKPITKRGKKWAASVAGFIGGKNAKVKSNEAVAAAADLKGKYRVRSCRSNPTDVTWSLTRRSMNKTRTIRRTRRKSLPTASKPRK